MIDDVVERMPLGDPGACLQECAETVVAYIQTYWVDAPAPTPRPITSCDFSLDFANSANGFVYIDDCLLYTSPSPRDRG